jgi:hypothetical protein
LRVVVVVVVVVVGRRVVVVVGSTAVVVVVVVTPVVVAAVSVVVVVVLDVVVVVVEELECDDEDELAPVVVTVRLGCPLRLTTTISPPFGGGRPCGDFATAAWDTRSAANAAPISAPKASRPEPPSAVSIHNDYRPHPVGSNPSGHLVPA